MSSDPTNTSPPKDEVSEVKPAATEQKIADAKPHGRDSIAAEGDWHKTHHDFQEHGHNPTLQRSVEENPDLTLHYSHEHQHNHMHHGRTSLSGRHDDILYAKGTTFDKPHIPDQDFSHHHSKLPSHMIDSKDQAYTETDDTEKGGFSPTKVSTNDSTNDGRKHRFSRFYRKYKIFFHLFIWLVFTA